jgi:hypothetical protein
VATGTLNATGEERRGAVCGRTACTVRCRRREETRPVGPARAARPRRLPPTLPRPRNGDACYRSPGESRRRDLVLARSRATRHGRRRPALAMPRNSDPTRSASVTRPNIAPADSNANLKRSATRSASSKSSRPSKPPEQPQSQPPAAGAPADSIAPAQTPLPTRVFTGQPRAASRVGGVLGGGVGLATGLVVACSPTRFGHRWNMAQRVRPVPRGEVARAAAGAFRPVSEE